MDWLSGFVLRHRLAVGLVWLAVLAAGLATAGSVSGLWGLFGMSY